MTQQEHPKERPSHYKPSHAHESLRNTDKRSSLPIWLLVACLGVGAYAFISNQGGPKPAASTQNNSNSLTPVANISVSQNIVPTRDIPAALAISGYSEEQQSQIKAAIERKEAHLVIMPIFDATGGGGIVNVTCGPWSKVISLSPKPIPLILPISKTGVVNITPIGAGAQGIGPGIVTIFGPQPLPTLYNSTDLLSLTVSAQ